MKVLSRILLTLFILFVLVFVGFQIYRYSSSGYQTETALLYTTADRVSTVGVAVRSEKLIDTPKSNVVGYLYEDGAKVAAGSLILEVYNTRTALNMRSRLDQLEAEIEMLEDAQKTGLNYLANTEYLSRQILSSAYQLMDSGSREDFTGVFEQRMEFLSLLNKKKIATERETDYSARIDALQKECESISASMPQPVESVSMPITGYFSSVTDGLETVYTPEKLFSLDVEDVQEMIRSTTAYNSWSVGKVITEFDWYFAVVVTAAEASSLKNAGSITATFSTLGIRDIPFKLYKTVVLPDAAPSDGESPVAVIFTSNYMNAGLSALRVQNVELSMRTYTGLRVNKEAIRFQNGVKGVYVEVGHSLKFKPIEDNILYEGIDYLLVLPSDNARELQQYDRVVIRGNGLG